MIERLPQDVAQGDAAADKSGGRPFLEVKDLSVKFPTEDGMVHAVDGVDLARAGQDARHGGRVGLR